jgi:hypothetical protein
VECSDVGKLDVERQPDLIGPMFGCGQRKFNGNRRGGTTDATDLRDEERQRRLW